MSYECHLNHIEELDEKFKPSFCKGESLEDLQNKVKEQKLDIVVACMKSSQNDNTFTIKLMCKCLVNAIENAHKKWLEEYVEQEHGDIWFCGREYIDDYCDFDKETIIDDMIENLVILSRVVETPDYFDDEEKFFKKKSAIEEAMEIDEFLDEVINHELIQFYGRKPEEKEEEF